MSFLGLTSSHKLSNTFRKNTKSSTNQARGDEYDDNKTARSDAGFDAYFEDNVNEGFYTDREPTASDISRAGLETDMRIEAMNNLLEEVTLEVTEANKQHKAKLPLKPDGEQSRYEKRSPSSSHPIGDSFCPQPLQPRSRTLAATDDTGENLAEALKASESIAVLQQEHLLELERQKAIHEAIEQEREQEKQKKSVLGTLKRKVSSTFQKDTTEQAQPDIPLTPLPPRTLTPSKSQSSLNSYRNISSSKAATYRGEILPTISENDAPEDRSTIASNTSSLRPNEQAEGISPRDSGYSGGEVTTPSPQAKSLIPKPSLTINASQANKNAPPSHHVLPALSGSQKGLGSAVGSQLNLPFTSRKSSRTAGNTDQGRRRIATMSSPAISHTPSKKREKFKHDDPRVKMVERAILREEWGVNTTPQLTSEYRIVPPSPKKVPKVVHTRSWYRSGSHSNVFNREEPAMGNAYSSFDFNRKEPATGNASSSFHSDHEEPATSYDLSNFQFDPEQPTEDVGAIEPAVHDSFHPHYSFESAASNGNTYESRDSTVPSSELRASAETLHSVTFPQSPDTPRTATSSHVTGKEIGAHGGSMMSPLQPVGRPLWSFDEDVTNSARSSTGRVAGRSLTDPFDSSVIDTSKSGGFGDDPAQWMSRSPEFPMVAPLKQKAPNLGKPSDQNTSPSIASFSRGNQGPELGFMDDRTMNPSSSVNTVISGPGIATKRENQAELVDTSYPTNSVDTINLQQQADSLASATLTSQNISERDFQNAFKAGVPSNRLKLEEEAEAERILKELSKEDYVAYRVAKLRKKTNTEVVFYNETDDAFPKHPNHKRIFHSKNLWCTECRGFCGVCDTACCAWKNATYTFESSKATFEQKLEAGLLKHEIERWVVGGIDDITFLQCTDCYKLACTDCIGSCPIYPCWDRVCAQCNPGRLWQPCEYHDEADMELSEKMKREMEQSGQSFD